MVKVVCFPLIKAADTVHRYANESVVVFVRCFIYDPEVAWITALLMFIPVCLPLSESSERVQRYVQKSIGFLICLLTDDKVRRLDDKPRQVNVHSSLFFLGTSSRHSTTLYDNAYLRLYILF